MGVLDFVADLAGVGRPEGDPAAVRVAANQLSGFADALDRSVAAIDQTVAQASAGWQGEASERFEGAGQALRTMAADAALAMREAAGALNVYAARLQDAQQRWESARNDAITGRVTGFGAIVDPDLRRAIAQAEEADADATAAARALGGELQALAERAAPLPAGVTPPTYQRGGGWWLKDWVDRAWGDPLGAAGQWFGQWAGGVGNALKGWWDLALVGAKLDPRYFLFDPAGYRENLETIGAMGVGMFKLTDIYAAMDPEGATQARTAFLAAIVGWDTLKTGNVPRWQGQMLPDALLTAATLGGGAAARGGTGAARGALRLSSGARRFEYGDRMTYFQRWEKYADQAYDRIRGADDVAAIAQDTGWSQERIQRIKDHLFYNEHRLFEDRVARFDTDPDIADAWTRLTRGEHRPEDLRLLEHEYFEARFESIFGVDYPTAHDATLRSGRTWEPPPYPNLKLSRFP